MPSNVRPPKKKPAVVRPASALIKEMEQDIVVMARFYVDKLESTASNKAIALQRLVNAVKAYEELIK